MVRTTPLWEVFIRPRNGLSHKHVGSIHAADEVMAVQAARALPDALADADVVAGCLLERRGEPAILQPIRERDSPAEAHLAVPPHVCLEHRDPR